MNRLRRPHRYSLYLVGGVLLATGAAWAAFHYVPQWLGVDERSGIEINAALIKLHGAAAMFSLVLIGTTLARHVGAGWQAARNKLSGIAILALAVLLIITGYLLYYAGDEQLRETSSVLHLAAGVILPAFVIAHAWRLMRQRRHHIAGLRALRRAHSRTGLFFSAPGNLEDPVR